MGTRKENLMNSNIAALGVEDIFRDADTGESDIRFIPFDGVVTIALVASAVGIELTLFAGDRTIVQRETVEAGGTTGVFPNMREKAYSFDVFAGEKLRGLLRETANVATTDVMTTISYDY